MSRQGFLEVDTPSRVPSPGQEVHLDALAVQGGRYLITSPEYHMKRLVAAGMHHIVQFARCFRAGEQGPHHEPEFTMVEWYRANQPLEAIARDCEQVLRFAAKSVGRFGSVTVPPSRGGPGVLTLDGPFERTTVTELLARHAQVELRGDETAEELREKVQAAGHDPRGATGWDDIFFQLFLDRVEPHLGRDRPIFVFDWPVQLGALARRKSSQPHLVERFELYAAGLELANAFGELTDPEEQRARFVAETRQRAARGKAEYPIDEKLLAALPLMPPTAGVALGFDRLVMLVLGASTLQEVLAFADSEA